MTPFRIDTAEVDPKKFMDVRWFNDGKTKDISISETTSTYTEGEHYIQYISEAWGRLKDRALAEGHPNLLYDSTVLRTEQGLNQESNPDERGLVSIKVSPSAGYKQIVTLRQNQELLALLTEKQNPLAYAVLSILISADNKIVVGRRKFFGDWPSGKFELPGAFARLVKTGEALSNNVAIQALVDDYSISKADVASTIPAVYYYFPTICETQTLNITRTKLSASEIISTNSAIQLEKRSYDNSPTGLTSMLQELPSEEWHPPSFVTCLFYLENFERINNLK